MPVTTNFVESADARSQSDPSSHLAALHGAFASLAASCAKANDESPRTDTTVSVLISFIIF